MRVSVTGSEFYSVWKLIDSSNLSKLPQEVRIQVARNTAREVWEISKLLDVIQQEVEARELSEGVKTNVNTTEKPKQSQFKLPPSSVALVAEGGTQPPSMSGN